MPELLVLVTITLASDVGITLPDVRHSAVRAAGSLTKMMSGRLVDRIAPMANDFGFRLGISFHRTELPQSVRAGKPARC